MTSLEINDLGVCYEKIVCLLLTIVMILSLGVPAFAENEAVNVSEVGKVIKLVKDNNSISRLVDFSDYFLWETDMITSIQKNLDKPTYYYHHVSSVAYILSPEDSVNKTLIIEELLNLFNNNPTMMTTSSQGGGSNNNYKILTSTSKAYCTVDYVSFTEANETYSKMTKVYGSYSGTTTNVGNSTYVTSQSVTLGCSGSAYSTTGSQKPVEYSSVRKLATNSHSWTTWAPTSWPYVSISTGAGIVGATYNLTLKKGNTQWTVPVVVHCVDFGGTY